MLFYLSHFGFGGLKCFSCFSQHSFFKVIFLSFFTFVDRTGLIRRTGNRTVNSPKFTIGHTWLKWEHWVLWNKIWNNKLMTIIFCVSWISNYANQRESDYHSNISSCKLQTFNSRSSMYVYIKKKLSQTHKCTPVCVFMYVCMSVTESEISGTWYCSNVQQRFVIIFSYSFHFSDPSLSYEPSLSFITISLFHWERI